jgi:hypothetical protein
VQQEESECDKEKGSWIKFKKESGMDTSRTQSSGPIFLSIPLKQVGSNKVQISYTILTTMPKDNIYDRIPAKPTKYKGRQYRSRLEARVAAFFDIINMDAEYEPIDLNGWSPDFALKTTKGNTCYVEVKPTEDSFDLIKIIKAVDLKKNPVMLFTPTNVLVLNWSGFMIMDTGNAWIEAANVVQFLKPEVSRG